ncbi:Hint domain-containing protein [Sulfitobacter sp. MF3-043]|uniref:Hint domain-containing protein n=1 Tax=Sulfitobacter sediminivivens TaxID=3252902 RepID=UPI0036DD1D98
MEFLDTQDNVVGRTDYSEIQEVIICFTPGTRIATIRGEMAVETMKEGDQIITRDNGVRPLRWIGRRDLNRVKLEHMPSHCPILIGQSALGRDAPRRDMLVSPYHHMVITSHLAEVMFGEREVLVAAKHLTRFDGVDSVQVPAVSYIHLMFDNHEVILADGCWAESFQPGDHSMAGIRSQQRREILALFPELGNSKGLNNYFAARRLLRAHEAQLLTA